MIYLVGSCTADTDTTAGQVAAERWNRQQRIGAPVAYQPHGPDTDPVYTTTRSNVWLLDDGTPVLLLTAHPVAVPLAQVQAQPAGWTPPPDKRRLSDADIARLAADIASEAISVQALSADLWQALPGSRVEISATDVEALRDALQALAAQAAGEAHRV